MKPQTPGMGFFYALMMEETGKLYLIAGPVYSNFQGPGRLLVESVYRKLEKPGFGQNLYTQKSGPRQIPGPGRIQKARKAWTRAEPVYSNFQGPGRSLVNSVYNMLENPGLGQNLYTQIFRIQAGSWSKAYTESSKSLDPGRISILKFSGPRQALVLGRIQDTRKNWVWAESVYSNFPGSCRFLFWGVYRMLEKPGPGRNLYTQIFRAQ